MKVDVLQVGQAKFSKWHWWSYWIDVAVFDFDLRPYLLQMKVSRTNKKKFKAVMVVGRFHLIMTSIREIGDLMPMKKEVQ